MESGPENKESLVLNLDILDKKDFEDSFQQVAKSLNKIAYEMTQTIIINQQKMMEELSTSITGVFKHIISNIDFHQQFDGILESFRLLEEEFNLSEKEITNTLSRYKWSISPNFPIAFLAKVVEIGKKEGNQKKAINQLFVGYLTSENCKNLFEMVEDWEPNPLFKSRMKILRDCVHVLAKSDKSYNASNFIVPTLITQIDGILSSFAIQNNISRSDKNWKTNFRLHTNSDFLDELTNKILLDLLFQKALPGKPLKTPFTFSRHKIMHGEYTRYGRIDNTLRAFLVLDFLHSISALPDPIAA
jgi:hypothetical protein